LLELFFLEVERYYRRKLKRVTHRDELPAVEARNWKQALGLKHLRALI
jgi:hypothetical protein